MKKLTDTPKQNGLKTLTCSVNFGQSKHLKLDIVSSRLCFRAMVVTISMSRMLKSLTGSIVLSPSGLASDNLSSSCSAEMVVLPGGSFLLKNSKEI